VRQSARFYRAVLGWKIDDTDAENPKFTDRTGHLIGRWVSGRAVAARKTGVLPYFYVEGIHETLAQVESNGGEIVRPIFPEGNLWVSVVRDPAGNAIGLWQEATS